MTRSIFPKKLHEPLERFPILRWMLWIIEAVPVIMIWLALKLLPVQWAAGLGSAIAGYLGPRSHKQRHVLGNLAHVYPTAQPEALAALATGVWRNLGAVIAEYPHLKAIVNERVQWHVPERTRQLLDERRPALYLSGHLANWELMTGCFSARGVPMMALYRPHPNSLLEPVIQYFRRFPGLRYVAPEMAAKEMLQAVKQGESIGVLQDLRADGGVALPFFGVPALTSLVPIRIALRHGYPIVALRTIRCADSRFEIHFEEPFDIPAELDPKAAALAVVAQYHALLERWIGERTQEWLCTKRRWPKPGRLEGGAAGAVANTLADS